MTLSELYRIARYSTKETQFFATLVVESGGIPTDERNLDILRTIDIHFEDILKMHNNINKDIKQNWGYYERWTF